MRGLLGALLAVPVAFAVVVSKEFESEWKQAVEESNGNGLRLPIYFPVSWLTQLKTDYSLTSASISHPANRLITSQRR